MKDVKKETEIELLARTMAEGFQQINARFDGVDVRFDGVDNRLISLEKGQRETNKRLDSIERKQVGMLINADDMVPREEFVQLVQRVEVLET